MNFGIKIPDTSTWLGVLCLITLIVDLHQLDHLLHHMSVNHLGNKLIHNFTDHHQLVLYKII